jgi:hypothetical protein
MTIKLLEETVTFRDGSTVTIREADWIKGLEIAEIEAGVRLAYKAQEEADPSILDDPTYVKRKAFAQFIYPKISVCCINGHPSLEEALVMPATEVLKWYDAAKRVNPDWWETSEVPDPKDEEAKKKDGKSG